MLFLVELDHVESGAPLTPEAGRTFIEQVIFPTLARGEQLAAEGSILGGGAVVGRVALRFIVEADSSEQVDRMVTSLPLWPVAESRITPLLTLSERREHVKALLDNLASRG
jgi:muconolactone delta-isomerase